MAGGGSLYIGRAGGGICLEALGQQRDREPLRGEREHKREEGRG